MLCFIWCLTSAIIYEAAGESRTRDGQPSHCVRGMTMLAGLWLAQEGLEFLYRLWRIARVQHRVTIRADGYQIPLRIKAILATAGRQRLLMVHMDESAPDLSVALLETHATHRAAVAMPLQACLTGGRVGS